MLAPLLGKLYVSPSSSEEKIRDVYADVCDAVEHNLLSDATGRNALYKIHVSLGKIVNNLDAQEAAAATATAGATRAFSRGVSVPVEDKTVVEDRTVVPDADIKEEEEEDEEEKEEGDVVDDGDSVAEEITAVQGAEDSLVSDLLDDDGDTEMT